MKSVLRIDNLIVRRSTNFSLRINRLRLTPGKVLCVTGPNGSGKSTFLESTSGMLRPTGGLISIAGHPVSQNMRQTKVDVGYIPDDENWIIRELCAYEYFNLLAHIYKKAGSLVETEQNAKRLAKTLNFTSFNQQLGHLSHGNKKKVQLIAGLMHKPKLIVIDELRNGLDPLAIINAEKLLAEATRQGTSIVAATHDLWWAQRFADSIIMLDQGYSQVQNDTSSLVRQYGSLEALFIKNMESKYGSTSL